MTAKAASAGRRGSDYRWAAALTIAVLAASLWAPEARSASATEGAPTEVRVTFVPAGTGPERLHAEGLSPGLMSAGLSEVPAAQTYLDISQGNRVFDSLYDGPLPRASTVRGKVPPMLWRAVLDRARSAPADIVPGLLASTIQGERGVASANDRAGRSALSAVNRAGSVEPPESRTCRVSPCPTLRVTSTETARLDGVVRSLSADDLLVAIERPPPQQDGDQLAIGIAGRGFEGDRRLTSESTRLEGLVLSTDLAPTILERLGVAVPDDAMTGSPIRASGEANPAGLVSLEDRMAEIGDRRGSVIGISLLIWVALAALATAAFGARGAVVALPLLALSGIYVPAVLLACGSFEPTEVAERLVVGLGCPALAAATLAAVPGYGAAAIASAVSVVAYAVDVLVGSPLTVLSLIGPNPALGVRFFGIGNELEAAVATLIPIGVGAGLTALRVESERAAAAAFGVAALAGVVVFAPGRFGADVGAAIVLPVGAAVAAWFVLGGGRRRLAALLAVPVAALAILVGIELVLGGDAHLTRSVLEAGGLDDAADVIERRLRLSADSFARNVDSPAMLACVALIVAGVILRRRIAGWFVGRRAALAGLLGAVAATLVGTLANDSGALLLMIGTGFASLFVAFAWAAHVVRID